MPWVRELGSYQMFSADSAAARLSAFRSAPCPAWVGRERERVLRHLHADGVGLGTATLEPVAEQLTGQQVQGQDAAISVLRRLFDVLPVLDQVAPGEPDLLAGEVKTDSRAGRLPRRVVPRS